MYLPINASRAWRITRSFLPYEIYRKTDSVNAVFTGFHVLRNENENG